MLVLSPLRSTNAVFAIPSKSPALPHSCIVIESKSPDDCAFIPPSSSFACVTHSSDDTIQTSRSSLRRSSLSCSSSRFSHILSLTSLNQSPLTKPYKNLRPRRDQTVECQRVPGAVFKKKKKKGRTVLKQGCII